MSRWVAEVHPDRSIPLVRYRRKDGESRRDYIGRIAHALSFAFRVNPDDYAHLDDFRCDSDVYMLSNGLISRTWITGTFCIESDAELIEQNDSSQLFIYFFEEGRADMAPTRTGLPIRKGDILVMDVAQPGRLEQTDGVSVRLIVPRTALGENFADRDLHGCMIPADAPLAGILNACATRLMDDVGRMNMAEGVTALNMLLGLLAHALDERYARRHSQTPLRDRAHAVILSNLWRTELSASWVAEQLGVSRATLYRAFDNFGGVKNYIVSHRLIEAWPDIVGNESLSLAEIAAKVGFRSRGAMVRAFADLADIDIESVRDLPQEDLRTVEDRLSRTMIRNWELSLGRKLPEEQAGAPQSAPSDATARR